jgi:rare lipoprotein A
VALFPRISRWPDLITDRNVAAVAIAVLVVMAQSCTTLAVQQKMVNVLPHPSDQEEEITITPTSKKPETPPIIKVHTGKASWYGPGFKGKKTASGEIFDPAKFTAAHKTFPIVVRMHLAGSSIYRTQRPEHWIWLRTALRP